jgi:hypothetical protein
MTEGVGEERYGVDGSTLAHSFRSSSRMSRRIRRGDRHVYRLIAGEHLLVSIHRATVAPLFALTPTGAALWTRLEEWTTADSLADYLTHSYEVPLDRAKADVNEFLEQLESISALVVEAEELT